MMSSGRRSATPQGTRVADVSGTASVQKKLSPEELKNLGNRLAKPVPPPKDPGPLHAPATLPKQQVVESIERLYRNSVDRKVKNLKAACDRKEKQDRPITFAKMSQEDMDESVDRLYKKGLTHHQKHMDAIKRKHEFRAMSPADRMNAVRQSTMGKRAGSPALDRAPSPAPKVDSATVVSRLYMEEFTKKDAAEKARYNKYILSTEPKMAKRTKEEIADYVTRLYTGKKD